MHLGKKIRNLRLSQHMTLQKLSERVSISVSFLSDIEHNRSKPSLVRLTEIAIGLNTCVSHLLSEQDFDSSCNLQNYCNLSNILYTSNLTSDELLYKIALSLVSAKTWPESEKLELLNYIQSKNDNLLQK